MEEFLKEGDPLSAAQRLLTTLTRRDPGPIQRFWARMLRVLLTLLAMLRQGYVGAALTTHEALMALQCLETIENSHRKDEYLAGVMDDDELRQLRYELAQVVAKSFRASKQQDKTKTTSLEQDRGQRKGPPSSSFWTPCEDLLAPRLY